MAECIFCKPIPRVVENELAYAAYDINPVTKGHALIIVKRHIEQIFEASPEESQAVKDLLKSMKERLQKEHSPDGYNIWINCGRAAGQVVMHAHVHLIPRYKGEVLHLRQHFMGNME